MTFVKPSTDVFIHLEVYYKDQLVWKKFRIDHWENWCVYLNNRKNSYLIDWVLGRILKYVKYDGPLKCPFKGNLSVNVSKISLNQAFLDMPFIPSGHYRLDSTFTEANRNNAYAKSKLYAEISKN